MKLNLLTAGALMILSAACGNRKEESPAAEKTVKETSMVQDIVQLSPTQIKNAAIIIGSAQYREMHSTLNASGVVDVPPQNIISISIPMGGYVKRMMLIPGMQVKKGSVLATLEDPQYIQLQQDYLTGRSRLQFLEADFNRQKGLNATKATSDKLFQQVQNEYNSQEILVRSLAEKLRLIGLDPETLTKNNITRAVPVFAPITGYITKINVNVGKYITPTDVLAELVNPRDLHVRLTVFENNASSLATGQRVVLTSNSSPGKEYKATIHLITPSIGEDRTTEVHCDLDSGGSELLPGAYVNAQIRLNKAKVLSVPDEAIVKWEARSYIFITEGAGKFRLLNVQTGRTGNGFTEVTSALPEKDIITKNAYALLTKMKNSNEE